MGFKAGKTFKPNGTIGYRWRNGSSYHGDTQLHGGTSGTFIGTMKSGSLSNGSSYTNTISNSTFYDSITVRVYHSNNNGFMFDTLTFDGTIREVTSALQATGNFTCPNITAASATTKMGAVITYQDTSGTNALNTDIVLQLSADGGSNYSTATLTALPDFSTGIKMAKVNDLAVTSGTSLKYKISFANQASGSKEARIRGVSLNY